MTTETASNDPRSARRRRRMLNHIFLLVGNVAAALGLYLILTIPYPTERVWIFRWSLATAYVASVLLAATLSIGAWNLLRRRSNPVSIDLRRDIGIWSGIFAVIHTLVGLNVHMKSWAHYFVDDAGWLRADMFGFANYLGVLAFIVVIALLATSNDKSLTFLKSRIWKRIQRWSYVFAALTAAHAVLYIVVEKRIEPFLYILSGLAIWVAVVQVAGVLKRTKFAESTLKVEVAE